MLTEQGAPYFLVLHWAVQSRWRARGAADTLTGLTASREDGERPVVCNWEVLQNGTIGLLWWNVSGNPWVNLRKEPGIALTQ